MYPIWPIRIPSIPRQTLACSDTSLGIQDLQLGQRNSVFTALYGACCYSFIFSGLPLSIFNNLLVQCPTLTGLEGTCKDYDSPVPSVGFAPFRRYGLAIWDRKD